MRSTPRKDVVKIPALVQRVEVRVGATVVLDPIVRQHADVGIAHELLAQEVRTVIWNHLISASRESLTAGRELAGLSYLDAVEESRRCRSRPMTCLCNTRRLYLATADSVIR